MKALLALESSKTFLGESFGAEGETAGVSARVSIPAMPTKPISSVTDWSASPGSIPAR